MKRFDLAYSIATENHGILTASRLRQPEDACDTNNDGEYHSRRIGIAHMLVPPDKPITIEFDPKKDK